MDIIQLLDDLLCKEFLLILFVNSEQVTKGEQMFVAWDYKSANVKYMTCAFEGSYALDFINMLKDLLYKDTPRELHVYDTHGYFNTICDHIDKNMIKVHNFVKNVEIHIFVNKG